MISFFYIWLFYQFLFLHIFIIPIFYRFHWISKSFVCGRCYCGGRKGLTVTLLLLRVGRESDWNSLPNCFPYVLEGGKLKTLTSLSFCLFRDICIHFFTVYFKTFQQYYRILFLIYGSHDFTTEVCITFTKRKKIKLTIPRKI